MRPDAAAAPTSSPHTPRKNSFPSNRSLLSQILRQSCREHGMRAFPASRDSDAAVWFHFSGISFLRNPKVQDIPLFQIFCVCGKNGTGWASVVREMLSRAENGDPIEDYVSCRSKVSRELNSLSALAGNWSGDSKTIEAFQHRWTAISYVNLRVAYLRQKPYTDCRGTRKYLNGKSRLQAASVHHPNDWLRLALKTS
jgi:hypothetical protein